MAGQLLVSVWFPRYTYRGAYAYLQIKLPYHCHSNLACRPVQGQFPFFCQFAVLSGMLTLARVAFCQKIAVNDFPMIIDFPNRFTSMHLPLSGMNLLSRTVTTTNELGWGWNGGGKMRARLSPAEDWKCFIVPFLPTGNHDRCPGYISEPSVLLPVKGLQKMFRPGPVNSSTIPTYPNRYSPTPTAFLISSGSSNPRNACGGDDRTGPFQLKAACRWS